MRISAAQFSSMTLARFHSRCADILQDCYPDANVLRQELLQMIAVRDSEALGEGFASELARFRYIHAAFVMGEEFPAAYEPMVAVLNRKDLPPNERSYVLEKAMLVMCDSVSQKSRLETGRLTA